MRARVRLALAGWAAAALLLLAIGSAFGNKLSVSERSFRVVWSPMSLGLFPGGGTMRCPVTLEGSFNATTIAKRAGMAVGQVTRAASGACTGGTLAILGASLPWTIAYNSFTGVLPRITAVNLDFIGFSVQVSLGSFICLFRSTTEHPASEIVRREAGGVITGMATNETILLPSSTFGCEEASLGYSGTGAVTRPGTANSISLTLT